MRPDDLAVVREVCSSYCLDNGAFTAWKLGTNIDFDKYRRWVDAYSKDPHFDFALAPDVIDGSENENNAMLNDFKDCVPVFHLHESIERLEMLTHNYDMVALGSSGMYSTPGTQSWWTRMGQLMDAICMDGRPPCKLHGLRMLDSNIFTHLPLRSADSTNVAQNSSGGNFIQQAETIALRTEIHQSPQKWASYGIQEELL
jgi:hypothetical protein